MANPKDYAAPGTDWFTKRQLAPPTVAKHGTVEDIRAQMKRLETRNWRQVGNRLECDTDQGTLSQVIPTDYICLGTDGTGMPILRKIDL